VERSAGGGEAQAAGLTLLTLPLREGRALATGVGSLSGWVPALQCLAEETSSIKAEVQELVCAYLRSGSVIALLRTAAVKASMERISFSYRAAAPGDRLLVSTWEAGKG
jgi:hypothetical protein